MIKISKRVTHMHETPLRKLGIECEKCHGINLAQGVIDSATPEVILNGAAEAMRTGQNTYTSLFGNEHLRNAISIKLGSYNKVTYDPGNEILITAGGAGAFYIVCLGLLSNHDEVVVFEPYYPYFIDVLRLLGIRPVIIKLSSPNWEFDPDELRSKISKNTKAILINTPSNPTGKIFSLNELKILAEIARRFDLFVITDEVYEYFVYGDNRHLSPASLPELKERTITLGSFSKTFAITGWRIGYVACERQWALSLAYVNERIFICAPSPLQIGVAEGLFALPEAYYSQLKRDFERKKSELFNALNEANMEPTTPQGSFYMLSDISQLPGKNGLDKALNFLGRTSVACAPGMAFTSIKKSPFHDKARFSFGVSDEKLQKACEMIKTYSTS